MISFETLLSPLGSDKDDLVRFGYATLVAFGGLYMLMSFGMGSAFWVAVLIGGGVLLYRLGGAGGNPRTAPFEVFGA